MSTTASVPATESTSGDVERFWLWLGLIALGGLLVTIAAAVYYDRYTEIGGDAVWYSANAKFLVDGKGYIAPFAELTLGHPMPSAAHPPLYPLWLAIPSILDKNELFQRMWGAPVVAGTVIVLGLLGRDLAGKKAGLVAAFLGAISISLVVQNVNLWAEGLFAFTTVLTVWLSYRFIRAPGLLSASLLSGAIALASLTRAEGALLFLILLVPLALRARELALGRRIACIAVAGAVALAIFSPWLIYNNAGRFDNPVGLSTGLGGLIGSSNCPNTYDGPNVGGWGGVCAEGVKVTIAEDETLQDKKLLDAGLEYAGEHKKKLVAAIPFRIARSFGFYQPIRMTEGDLLFADGNARIAAWATMLQYWVYLAFGIVGLAMLWRRKTAVLPFVAPVVTVLVITVFGYGTMRFRVALDAILPALAAIAMVGLWRERRGRPAGRTTSAHASPDAGTPAPEPADPVGSSARTGTVGSDS